MTKTYELERQVGHLLRRANQRHTAIFADGIGPHQLTPMQLAVLVKIRDEGQVSQNRLGRLAAMDPATVQGVVKRLAERKLVSAGRDANDRRRSLWRLSAAGEKVIKEVLPAARKITDTTLAALNADERKILLDLLHKMK